jgi:chromosome segregation ATPase
MNTQDRVNEKIAKVALKNQQVDLGSIDDLIKEAKSEADNLWNTVNGYSANARDVSFGIDTAEKYYKQAKDAFEKFKNSEKEYNNVLDDVDKFYTVIKNEGFKTLNEYADLADELKKYGVNVKDYKTQQKEMVKAADDWKKLSNKFPKIK